MNSLSLLLLAPSALPARRRPRRQLRTETGEGDIGHRWNIIVRADSLIRTLEDPRGKPLGWATVRRSFRLPVPGAIVALPCPTAGWSMTGRSMRSTRRPCSASMEALPAGIKKDKGAVAETIANNVSSKIIKEKLNDPAFYDSMSALLNDVLADLRANRISYEESPQRIADLATQVHSGKADVTPKALDTPGKGALFNNRGRTRRWP